LLAALPEGKGRFRNPDVGVNATSLNDNDSQFARKLSIYLFICKKSKLSY